MKTLLSLLLSAMFIFPLNNHGDIEKADDATDFQVNQFQFASRNLPEVSKEPEPESSNSGEEDKESPDEDAKEGLSEGNALIYGGLILILGVGFGGAIRARNRRKRRKM